MPISSGLVPNAFERLEAWPFILVQQHPIGCLSIHLVAHMQWLCVCPPCGYQVVLFCCGLDTVLYVGLLALIQRGLA